MHLCSSMHLSVQHLYMRNYILHWFFFFVCKDSLSLDGLSPSRSPWWRWGCIAYLQFGSTSNCSAVLRVHIMYNQHLFGHRVILILRRSGSLLENQSMQNTFEQDNLELFFPLCRLLLWTNATKSLSCDEMRVTKHTRHIQNNDVTTYRNMSVSHSWVTSEVFTLPHSPCAFSIRRSCTELKTRKVGFHQAPFL